MADVSTIEFEWVLSDVLCHHIIFIKLVLSSLSVILISRSERKRSQTRQLIKREFALSLLMISFSSKLTVERVALSIFVF
jgi:hypothetical protein